MFFNVISILFSSIVVFVVGKEECQFLTMCKCTNFPMFTIFDPSYLKKPRSPLNQDLFCTFDESQRSETVFEQLKHFYYRFRTLTLSNYPTIPRQAFRYVHFETQSVKQTEKQNNRNVIALINVEETSEEMFVDLNLVNSHEQLIVSFLNSPRLIYKSGGLSSLSCFEVKFVKTNPSIPMDFFLGIGSIEILTIENAKFDGFVRSSGVREIGSIKELTISEINVGRVDSKFFPSVFSSVTNLSLFNRKIRNGFRSLDSSDLSKKFPSIRQLRMFSISIDRVRRKMFENLGNLEFLILNGIRSIENEGFSNLKRLKRLEIGDDLRQIEVLAFFRLKAERIFLDRNSEFELDDEKDFCTFAFFNPSSSSKTFVEFSRRSNAQCSCTLRYLYRNIDKDLLPLTPNCYSTASLYVLTQEERICFFDQRLSRCPKLPDEQIYLYGRFYNASDFHQHLSTKNRFFNEIFTSTVVLVGLSTFLFCFLVVFFLKRRRNIDYRHLHYLLQRRQTPRNRTDESDANVEPIYQTPTVDPSLTIENDKF